MVLITLILVLTIERLVNAPPVWHIDHYFSQYRQLLTDKGWLAEQPSEQQLWLVWLIPVAVYALITQWLLFGGAIAWLLDAVVLFLCLGCPELRACFKKYLNAASRGDNENCDLLAQTLHAGNRDNYTLGQHLLWINYRHYIAIIFWFVCLGGIGVLVSTLAYRLLQKYRLPITEKWLFWLDWIPSRIAAVGLLMVGHFSNAMPVFVQHCLNFQTPAKNLLVEIAKAAEEIDPSSPHCTSEPCVMVMMAKRNIIFFLVLIALLTLYGGLG